jgi:hypothetical protein
LVTFLSHVDIALPVLVRTLPELVVVVPVVLEAEVVDGAVEPELLVVVGVVPFEVAPDEVVAGVVLVFVVPVVAGIVPGEVLFVLVVGVLTIFFSCCQNPDQKDEIHPESARPERSGRIIFISGRFARLATISSI